MRILPIINQNNRTVEHSKGLNMAENTSGYAYFVILKGMLPDSVSFSGIEQTAQMSVKEFKRVAGPYLTCLYTGEPMLLSEQLSKMKKRGLFEGSIKEVVDNLSPYKGKYLEPIESEVFAIMEHNAKINPDENINELFNRLFVNSLNEVREEQRPLIDHIKFLGDFLPDDYRLTFKQYMLIVDKKLNGEPIVSEFSLKEFKYKLNKLTENLPKSHFTSTLENLMSNFDESGKNKSLRTTITNYLTFLFKRKSGNESKELTELQIICEIKRLANNYGYKRIAKLCDTNIKMLKKEPVYVPFSNKAFAYDLEKMFEGLPATRVKKQIIETAHRLPNSYSSVDALILKFKDAEPEAIGDRLFSPALLSVEHLLPQSQGGATTVQNCALTRRGPNSRRGSENLSETLKKYPRKNQQKYVNKLTVLVKKGLMPKEDALLQINQIENLGNISLNKSKLLNL